MKNPQELTSSPDAKTVLGIFGYLLCLAGISVGTGMSAYLVIMDKLTAIRTLTAPF